MFATDSITVRRYDDTRWELVEPLAYVGRWETFTVPAGFVTDFASVPQPVMWFVPRYGRYTAAAILHDYLIAEGRVSSQDTDGIFRRVLREEGVPLLLRWLMWAGVRWGALVDGRGRAGWLQDAPAVLGISLVAAPLVVPPVVVAAVAFGLYALAERLVAGPGAPSATQMR